MITILDEDFGPTEHDICIVGAGLIGLILALDCAKRGMKVLLLESGVEEDSEFHQTLARGVFRDNVRHAPLEIAGRRGFGGTSRWWGGRCLTMDAIDHMARPWVPHSGWPFPHHEMQEHVARAAAYLACGKPVFYSDEVWPGSKNVIGSSLERWSVTLDIAAEYRKDVARCRNIAVILDATLVDLNFTEDLRQVDSIKVVNRSRHKTIKVRRLVLACGGIQTTRQLLFAQRKHPSLFGGTEGPLGRYYMGHIFGTIADIVLKRPEDYRHCEYWLNNGAYVRRRFTLSEKAQEEYGLLQVYFMPGRPHIADPMHENGTLSMIWMLLASPIGNRLASGPIRSSYLGDADPQWNRHVGNVLRSLVPTAIECSRLCRQRYFENPPRPSLFIPTREGRYTLEYHSEQSPNPQSRLRLSSDVDAFGMPLVEVDAQISTSDSESVWRAHQVLAFELASRGIASIEFRKDVAGDPLASIEKQASDGFHQMGSARMSATLRDGVVNADCRVHDVDNLYLASTCVFPTSGHANPTLPGVALGLRLAAHLSDQVQYRPPRTSGSSAHGLLQAASSAS